DQALAGAPGACRAGGERSVEALFPLLTANDAPADERGRALVCGADEGGRGRPNQVFNLHARTVPRGCDGYGGWGASGGGGGTHRAEGRVRGGETGERHAVRRARHVVETHFVAEADRRRVATVLTADPELHVGPRRASPLDGQADELADTTRVERLERV